MTLPESARARLEPERGIPFALMFGLAARGDQRQDSDYRESFQTLA